MIHAKDAVMAQECGDRCVRAHHGAGVRDRERLADVGAAELVGDDRLARSMSEGREARDLLARSDGLEEKQEGIGLGIVG